MDLTAEVGSISKYLKGYIDKNTTPNLTNAAQTGAKWALMELAWSSICSIGSMTGVERPPLLRTQRVQVRLEFIHRPQSKDLGAPLRTSKLL